ncbi:unnamed protein product [Microthlaspi erraticum]|uniref:GRF-type domain-containing protein n=1 Tax=Microthlaspi erraticum TaxID=1685480 RepID=A0A6D2J2T3_9BRAS|nr:unnamed protein product [Microthlaspi erraticum]
MFQSVTSSDNENGVLCYCHRPAKIVRAWTRRNPGRRFYSCIGRRGANGWVSCKFFDWFDKEEPHGWQHVALLEAEQTIKEQKSEIEGLKNKVRTQTHHSANAGNSNALVDILKERNEVLEREVLILRERSIVLRNVLVASSVGLVVLVGGVMAKWKCM